MRTCSLTKIQVILTNNEYIINNEVLNQNFAKNLVSRLAEFFFDFNV